MTGSCFPKGTYQAAKGTQGFGFPGVPFAAMRLLALMLALSCTCLGAVSEKEGKRRPIRAGEHEVKAAAVFNLARFIQWPDGASPTGAPFVIAVIGEDPVLDSISKLTGRTVWGRPVKVLRAKDFSQIRDCRVLIYGKPKPDNWTMLPRHLLQKPLLSIGYRQDFLEKGGVATLEIIDDHLSITLNLNAARRSGLVIPASLLEIVNIVDLPADQQSQ